MNEPQTPTETRFADLLDPYESWLRWGNPSKPYSEHTIRLYLREVGAFIAFLDKNMIEDVEEVTNAVFRQYFAQIAQNGAKATTVRAKLSALDNFFEWGYLEDIFPLNPAERYKRLVSRRGRGGRVESRLPEVLSESQIDELIYSISSENRKETPRNLAIVGILLDTGIRVSELLGMSVQDGINMIEGQKLRVFGKGRKERSILPLGQFSDLYRGYIRNKTGIDPAMRQQPLFTTKTGRPLTQDAVYRIISRHLGKIGLNVHQKGAHLLRHTAATLMLRQGVDIAEVQYRLGHSNVATTGKYLHVTEG